MNALDVSISIIIPAYNVEKYLKAALDSIEAQTELPDEVILIDDGSTDKTLAVAERYHFSIPYKVSSIENGGQGNARNLGVSLASSEYVYFFDSDDLLKKDFIHSIKNQIRQNNSPDIVLFSGESFNDSEYQGNRWVNYRRGFSGVFFDRAEFLQKASSHNALFCSPCLYVSKKSLWGAHGLEFGHNFLEDDAIFFPVLFSCSSFVVVDEVFFLRRNREGSTMTMVRNAKHVNGVLDCLNKTLSLYDSADFTSLERKVVRNRIGSFCMAYIVMAREANVALAYKKIFKIIIKVRSPVIALKIFAFMIRANESALVRYLSKNMKRFKSVAFG
uniref:glycosyltransferase family A protein n=1 Tax=uncultured Halomonas sp. TaxID=173971 RepID=UPI00261C2A2D|nr:glycosyltransferase family 2 protein [uncultured Halomonas sp.]